ncbi:hypothetical protein, partial [Halomonas sp. 707B3]|uniref:hypothetical protein n=1 Tax=Halomonas sp. 707B3 TaxID=1681043 RepID=UPI00209DC432
GLAKANLHGANDQKVLAGGDRESVGAGFTDSGVSYSIAPSCLSYYLPYPKIFIQNKHTANPNLLKICQIYRQMAA